MLTLPDSLEVKVESDVEVVNSDEELVVSTCAQAWRFVLCTIL